MSSDNPMRPRDKDEYAFPVAMSSQWQPGMTLRDWFAGQALAGLVGNHESTDFPAMRAYQFADAMLAERDKGVSFCPRCDYPGEDTRPVEGGAS